MSVNLIPAIYSVWVTEFCDAFIVVRILITAVKANSETGAGRTL
jgi:hypothetical protein